MSWTLRRKFLLGYGTALAGLVVVTAWAFASLSQLGAASDAILRENYRSILAAENMVDAVERQDSAVLLLLLGEAQAGLAQFREHEGPFFQWLGRAKDNITIAGEREILERIETGYEDYLRRVSDLAGAGPPNAGGAAPYREALFPAFSAIRAACIELREINERTMFAASERARSIARRARWTLVLVGTAAVGLGLAFSLVLSALLVRPLRRMTEAAARLAQGDHEVEVPSRSTDEVGQLAREFNAMARKLKAFHDLNIGRVMEEKRKSKAIVRSLDDGVVVVDADLKVTSLNPAAARTLGVDEAKALHRHFLEVVRDERLFEHVRQTAEAGRPPPLAEGEDVLAMGPEGARRDYQFAVTPVLAEGGAMLGVVLLLRDVTRLAELDRLKTDFVLKASHELRTPLTSMEMGIGLLLESAPTKLDEKERELLAAAAEDVGRLKALVSDLLDLSRIEAGKMEMALEEVPADTLFRRAAAAMKGQAEEKGVRLTAEVPPDLPPVRADPTRITWVLVNLVANALRYTPRGGHVRLSAERAGARAHLRVADDGVGIPYEHQSRIFDKFVQVHGDATPGGSGLGLAICREIVRAHGGTIWVESAPGEGTTFTFALPLAG